VAAVTQLVGDLVDDEGRVIVGRQRLEDMAQKSALFLRLRMLNGMPETT